MSEIPLRSYLKQIEDFIDSGQLDQAVAHSRHILESYPKCVDAYRLLGKAFLESQRFTDSNDIFQRVLSTLPDDFVSHLGMSIIRADEGNINEAIWHMERAYEIQPANSAVQDELRNLFTRRDQLAPPIIRLTRGALARLYDRGELYQLAASEIRASLADDPNRLDLQALLASIYIKMDQHVEAAETAMEVLKRLPNCLVANQVMANVLIHTNRTDELEVYQTLIAEIDPYSKFISSKFLEANLVPDRAVTIEPLEIELEPRPSETPQPDWTAELSTASGKIMQEQPEFFELSGTEPSTTVDFPQELSVAPFIFDEEEQQFDFESNNKENPTKDQESTPNWLFDADRMGEEGMDENIKSDTQTEFETSVSESAQNQSVTELPDWLQQFEQPSESDQDSEEEIIHPGQNEIPQTNDDQDAVVTEKPFLPDWLLEEFDGASPHQSSNETMGLNDENLNSTAIENDMGFDWFSSDNEDAPPEDEQSANSESGIPDWIQSLQDGYTISEEDSDLDETQLDQPEVFQEELQPPTTEAQEVKQGGALKSQDDILEWLQEDFSDQETKNIEETPQSTEQAEDLGEWFSDLESSNEDSSQKMTSSSELPEWLIEEAPFAGQGQTVAAENADDDNFPSWLDEANDISDAFGPDADDDSEEEHEWRLESKERTPETSEPIFEALGGWVDQLETEPEEISRENPADDDTQPTQIDQTEDETVTNEAVDKEWSFTDGGEASDSIYEELEIIPDETRLADEAQISGEQEPATAIDPIDEAFSWLMGLRAATENSDFSDDTAQPAFETTNDWLAERNPAIENNESSNELTDSEFSVGVVNGAEDMEAEEVQNSQGMGDLSVIQQEVLMKDEEMLSEEENLRWLDLLTRSSSSDEHPGSERELPSGENSGDIGQNDDAIT